VTYYLAKAEQAFQANWHDWQLGGPSQKGWTRTGPFIALPSVRLAGHYTTKLLVEQCLAKNALEANKWHLAFLQGNTEAYWHEYLSPRYAAAEVANRAREFLLLVEQIRLNGVMRPVWVADVSRLGLHFNYFRFDGCHRICAAKHLGQLEVPATVFTLR
jgi:hypothetical protein